MYLERHQKIAIGLFCATVIALFHRDDFDKALARSLGLFATLLPIIFYRLIAYFAGFGFPEVFAKDYGSENHPGPYALFFWIVYLLVCAILVFEWSLY
jgi:hypothetical protein